MRWLVWPFLVTFTSPPPQQYCGIRPKGLYRPTTGTTRVFYPEIGRCVFHHLHSAGVWPTATSRTKEGF